MTRILLATAAALALAAPAMASDLGCWDTQSVEPNPAQPAGSYLTSGSSADYMLPGNEGVGALLADLSTYQAQDFVVCLQGDSSQQDGNTVWDLSAAIICEASEFSSHDCPG